jgi:phosphopantothenoylcysteine decarboxylase/phosphopantothenate--cysteine ligase
MATGLQGRRIAVGVGGGIAAYKACDLCRQLQRGGAEVRVALTPAAAQFVTPLTFQNLTGRPVLTDYFDPAQEAAFGHLDFAKWAELFVVAPATADLLARIRAGMANDAVTTPLLAYRGTVLLAPAMNVAMWENRLTQQNLKALLSDPRFRTVGPSEGELACGDVGQGRLAEVDAIVAAALAALSPRTLQGQKILITAGPTREYADPVRFISNPSTGKMGLALAQEARARGAEVTVVLGPVGGADRQGLEIIGVVSAEEMAREVLARVDGVDVFVAAAAVSDWRPKTRLSQKAKKHAGDEALALERTPDVLALASRKVRGRPGGRPLLVGFAAETEALEVSARDKLTRKGLDLIVANDVSQPDAGFGVDTNRVLCLASSGLRQELSGSKREVARGIWDLVAELRPD